MHLLRRRGDYHSLITYRKAKIIYLITYHFAHTFLSRGDRTVDQMIQAARSGKQNIVEGSRAAATSARTEIKLTNVARASLMELLEDYEDYLQSHNLRQWEEGSAEYEAMRRIGRTHDDPEYYRQLISTRPAATIANIAIILLRQNDYLLHRQLERLSKDFLADGGFTERMTAMRRLSRRDKNP